ncbi:hypothetical protein PTSG_09338 [Salpingoeca rosetta]|uniref:Uncharacterized protein n=1 Tax=Salpingoeca rosetta (strain ATCC 50818 / BSB-021) TaxID=946362 RepID=F2UMC5_SALR5|nr:uncharacterized protein PTSG_09338 [Salpingoeca rosetta]EGD78274.1 hypothetical protein PTSG_09338 [Salpingoeca rosetta]|eukprot:XP_004989597.1 hypothetical protein PTSG_09338 [Salpingoeca rosetta]
MSQPSQQHPLLNTTGVSAAFLRSFLDDIKSTFPEDYGLLTTKDVCDKLIVPRTKAANCAYVDKLKEDAPDTLGRANIFVSHAWRYKITDVIATMLEFAAANSEDTSFFWLDLFVNNQNIALNLPQDWWSTTFKDSITSIGHSRHRSDPIPLTRAWCLWEIFCGLSQDGVRLSIQLPGAEEQELKKAILQESSAVLDALVRVRAERAQVWNTNDKEMIFKAIEDSVGFTILNEKVKDQMRAWCLNKVVQFVEQAKKECSVDPRVRALLCNRAGNILHRFGASQQAAEYFRQGLDLDRETLGDSHQDTATSYANLGSALDANGDVEEAMRCFQQCLDIQVDTIGKKHEDTAATLVNLGGSCTAKGDYDKAIQYYMDALTIQQQVLGKDHPAAATTLNNLGRAYSNKGDHDRAIQFYHTCLKIRLPKLGDKHPDTATAYSNIGSELKEKGEYENAVKHYEDCLNIQLVTLGKEHPETAGTYNNLGLVYKAQQDYERAVENFRTCLQIQLRTLGTTHANIATSYNNLGSTLKAMRKYEEALEYYEKALNMKISTVGEDHPSTAVSLLNIGRLHQATGKKERANEYYKRALRAFEATLGASHPHTVTASKFLAETATKSK